MNYHPDIELLLKYSNGSIEPALSVAIGLHQRQCLLCQQRVADLESIAGENLEHAQNAIIDDSDFDKLMGDLDALPEQPSLNSDLTADSMLLAVAESDLTLLDSLANLDFANLKWQKVTGKISRVDLAMNDDIFQAELIRFSPNAKIPKHTHLGKEFTLVLEGDFSDHQGVYQKGEFIEQGITHEHQPIAGKSGCICLAITNAPLKFTGTFGPIINWFSRKN